MIVECKSCQTRFRIDDSKVSPRGVKVRCSKCKHTFVINKDDAAPAEPTPAPTVRDTPIQPPEPQQASPRLNAADLFGDEPTKLEKPVVNPSATQPMFGFNPADIRTSQTAEQFDLDSPDRAGDQTWTERSDPFSLPKRPAANNPFGFSEVPPTTPVPQEDGAVAKDPFAGSLDLKSSSVQELSNGAGFDIDIVSDPGNAAPGFEDKTAAIPDPFGKLDAAPTNEIEAPPMGAQRPAASTDPFAEAMPEFPPPPPAGDADPFAALGAQQDPFSDLPEAGAGDIGLAAPPPGPDAGPDPLASPPGEHNQQQSADDLFADLGLPAQLPFEVPEPSDDLQIDAETRVHEVGDLANLIQESQTEKEEAAKKAHEVAEEPSTSGPAPPASSAGRSRAYQLLQGAVGLLIALGLLLGVYSFRGGAWDTLGPEQLFNVVLFGPGGAASDSLPTSRLDVAYYQVGEDERVIVVVGEVHNNGSAALPGVVVEGRLLGPEEPELTQKVYAGAELTPFDLRSGLGASELSKIVERRVSKRAAKLEPGASWPFSLVFSKLPEWSPNAEIAVSARAADAPRAVPVEHEREQVEPAAAPEKKRRPARPPRRPVKKAEAPPPPPPPPPPPDEPASEG